VLRDTGIIFSSGCNQACSALTMTDRKLQSLSVKTYTKFLTKALHRIGRDTHECQ
jgi:hypothetical protein